MRVRHYELNEHGVDGSAYPINDESLLDVLYLLNAFPSARSKFKVAVIKISEVISNLILNNHRVKSFSFIESKR